MTFSNNLQSLAEVRNFYSPGADGTPPIPFSTYDYDSSTVGVRLGGLISIAYRDRDFKSRRLRFNQFGSLGLDFFESPNTLFREEDIRPNAFELFEGTRVTDRYHADRNVYAGFGQVDPAFNAKWRMVAGLRVERTDQLMATFNPFDLNDPDPTLLDGSPAGAVGAAAIPPDDGLFDQHAQYNGAFAPKGENWTDGWTYFLREADIAP